MRDIATIDCAGRYGSVRLSRMNGWNGGVRARAVAFVWITIAITACGGASHERASMPAPTGLHPSGAECAGKTSVTRRGDVVSMRFTPDDPMASAVEYVVDLGDPSVRAGMLRVREATTGATVLSEAGLIYRLKDGRMAPPEGLVGFGELEHAVVKGGRLVLDARDDIEDEPRKRYELSLHGRSLRVRMRSLNDTALAYGDYAGATVGPMRDVGRPRDLKLPHMVAYPVTRFEGAAGPAFAGVVCDFHASRATDWVLPVRSTLQNTLVVEDDSIRNAFSVVSMPMLDEQSIAAPVDETFWVTVSDRVRDLFPTSSHGPSPHRDRMAGRMVAVFGGESSPWPDFRELVEAFDTYGIDDLFIYAFAHWTSHELSPGLPTIRDSHFGPRWCPARDENELRALVDCATTFGYDFALYTVFEYDEHRPDWCEPSDLVRGIWTEEMQRRPMAPSRQMRYALREHREIHERYGTNAAQTDVIPACSPILYVDLDPAQPDKEKTIGDVVASHREMFRAISEIHDGPIVSEGSMGPYTTNCELLYAGVVDSVDGIVNTASGKHARDLAADDPFAPLNWHVVPDFVWYAESRVLLRNGNGFYDRFFPAAQITFPLPEELCDAYRAYEITYGHSPTIISSGRPDHEMLFRADMIKEYWLGSELTRRMLQSSIESIRYEIDGKPHSLEEALTVGADRAADEAAAHPLDALRDPRITLRFTNGLTVHVNHGAEPWVVTTPLGKVTLPENGFVASEEDSAFVVLSGIPEGVDSRIDYADIPGKARLLDGRGAVESFRGLTSGAARRLHVELFERGVALVEESSGAITVEARSFASR